MLRQAAALAVFLALPSGAVCADWQSCASSLSMLRSDAGTAQHEAEAAVRAERDLETSKRELDSCRSGGRDINSENCRSYKQSYDAKASTRQSQERSVQFQLTILERSISSAALACGRNFKFMPLTPTPGK